MEDYRLIEIEEDFEDEEDYDDEEYEQDFIPERIMFPTDSDFIFDAGEVEDEDGDDYYDDEEEDDYYDDEDDDEDEDYDEEEVEELIPVEMTSSRVSSSIADGRTLQGALVINNGLLDDSNDSEGKPGNQEIDGLFCPICFEAWTSGGDHQICCLPCGHIYGFSCIMKWLLQHPSSGKCPQCNNLCTYKDVRVLYATRLCVVDEELQKRVRLLEAKCAFFDKEEIQKREEKFRKELFQEMEARFEQMRQEMEARLEQIRQESNTQYTRTSGLPRN